MTRLEAQVETIRNLQTYELRGTVAAVRGLNPAAQVCCSDL